MFPAPVAYCFCHYHYHYHCHVHARVHVHRHLVVFLSSLPRYSLLLRFHSTVRLPVIIAISQWTTSIDSRISSLSCSPLFLGHCNSEPALTSHRRYWKLFSTYPRLRSSPNTLAILSETIIFILIVRDKFYFIIGPNTYVCTKRMNPGFIIIPWDRWSSLLQFDIGRSVRGGGL